MRGWGWGVWCGGGELVVDFYSVAGGDGDGCGGVLVELAVEGVGECGAGGRRGVADGIA